MNKRQIIAIGGGGFSGEPENPAMELYILQQCRKTKPNVCFIPTASGDANQYIVSFYSFFSRFDCRPSHLPFFARTPELRPYLLDQDVIYAGGGNTKSMLAVWREWELDRILREAWESGVILSGISAGAICWFQQGITDSFAADLEVLDCLGFLGGSCCPHYDGEAERRPAYHAFLSQNRIQPGYAIEDGAAIHFIGDDLHKVIASRPKAGAYRMRLVNGAVEEQPLSTELICSGRS
jgi:peptidase E